MHIFDWFAVCCLKFHLAFEQLGICTSNIVTLTVIRGLGFFSPYLAVLYSMSGVLRNPLISWPGIILIDGISVTNRNIMDEIGLPCLIPLSISHTFDIHPLFFNLNIGSLYSIEIHLWNSFPKLNCLRVSKCSSIQLNQKLFGNLRRVKCGRGCYHNSIQIRLKLFLH